MKETPILFSGDMVRAALSGQKTQHRVPIRVDNRPTSAASGLQAGIPSCAQNVRFTWGVYLKCDAPLGSATVSSRVECPFGDPGDRLYVLEQYKTSTYSCDEDHTDEDHECGVYCKQTLVYYEATPRRGLRVVPDGARMTYLDDSSPLTDWYTSGWRPAAMMPKLASRITLPLVDVRVERVQNISAEDALAEGVTVPRCGCEVCSRGLDICPADATSYIEGFRDLWAATYGRESWEANPWVWVLRWEKAIVKGAS